MGLLLPPFGSAWFLYLIECLIIEWCPFGFIFCISVAVLQLFLSSSFSLMSAHNLVLLCIQCNARGRRYPFGNYFALCTIVVKHGDVVFLAWCDYFSHVSWLLFSYFCALLEMIVSAVWDSHISSGRFKHVWVLVSLPLSHIVMLKSELVIAVQRLHMVWWMVAWNKPV